MGKAVHHVICIIVLLSALLTGSWCAHAASGETFDILASNNPPFNYQDDHGQVQGIAIDVLKLILKRVDPPVTLSDIQIINWARAVHRTWTESNHILLSPARTPKREDMFTWVGPLHSFKLGLIARKAKHVTINDAEDLQRYNIGVIRDSAPAHILEDRFGISKSQMTELPKEEQLFLMLQRDRVDLIPRGAMSAAYWFDKLDMVGDKYEMVYVLKEVDLYIAFSPGTSPDLIDALNRELHKIKQGDGDGTSEYRQIIARHVHGAPLLVR